MKSYLSLIPISAKVHRRQNRMTLLCIIFAVFLVTAVFSMADMGVRMERDRLLSRHQGIKLEDLNDSAMGQSVYLIAAVLFVLILLAGVLMISSSINSNVAQRIKFFGMMRCIGMSRQQVKHFVRLEALNWCKTAVPIGILLGIAATWILCIVLRFLVGEEFSGIPLFGISGIGILSGAVVGIITVLFAARSPAKRASKVSPVTAASGNSEYVKAENIRKGAYTHLFKMETALGIHHAVSAKKNLVLVTGSFALSMILFLSFSVLIDFAGYLMPQSSSASDVNISSQDGSNSIERKLLDTIRGMDGVKRVYGRRSSLDIPAEVNGKAAGIDLISYDDFELDALAKDKMLVKGSKLSEVKRDGVYILGVGGKGSVIRLGDKIKVGNEELEIAGLLKYDLFTDDGISDGKITLITSDNTFTHLTGQAGYSLVMIQTTKNITDEQLAVIESAAGKDLVFSDKRGDSTAGTYMVFVCCVYGFLGIITLVTVLNIVNSISMSVSARSRQYKAMRAVGMDRHQMTKMIAAEAFTYALCGCVTGCAAGLFISRGLYQILIVEHFDYAVWSLPVTSLLVILFLVLLTVAAAVYGPSKRVQESVD